MQNKQTYRVYITSKNDIVDYYPSISKQDVNKLIDKYNETISPVFTEKKTLKWHYSHNSSLEMTVINNSNDERVNTNDVYFLTP